MYTTQSLFRHPLQRHICRVPQSISSNPTSSCWSFQTTFFAFSSSYPCLNLSSLWLLWSNSVIVQNNLSPVRLSICQTKNPPDQISSLLGIALPTLHHHLPSRIIHKLHCHCFKLPYLDQNFLIPPTKLDHNPLRLLCLPACTTPISSQHLIHDYVQPRACPQLIQPSTGTLILGS